MQHKAFEIIGERVKIVSNDYSSLGIFQPTIFSLENKCFCCEEIIKVVPGKTLDFISPVYQPNQIQEKIAMDKAPRERINARNPILHFWLGLDLNKIIYLGKGEKTHSFIGDLHGADAYFNDGNFEVYDKYKEPLRKAGFDIY